MDKLITNEKGFHNFKTVFYSIINNTDGFSGTVSATFLLQLIMF